MFADLAPSPIQYLNDPVLKEKGVTLALKREDLLHPEVSGNKWRKLKYNIGQAENEGKNTLLTFGGAYSNHIYATAAVAHYADLKSIGIIRGEEHLPLNTTLEFALEKGMGIHYVSREAYRNKYELEFLVDLHQKFGDFYLIPEGGTNHAAVKGCTEIVSEIAIPYDVLCCSVGTGGTLAGLIAGLKGEKKVLGFSALKGNFLKAEVQKLLLEYTARSYSNWDIIDIYHFGGYAKINPELITFIKEFKASHEILLDPIYTGKMLYGLYDLIHNDYFRPGTNIIALHTGGLQGWQGVKERFGVEI